MGSVGWLQPDVRPGSQPDSQIPPSGVSFHALKFLPETLDSFSRKATMAHIFLSRTGGSSAPKLGIALS